MNPIDDTLARRPWAAQSPGSCRDRLFELGIAASNDDVIRVIARTRLQWRGVANRQHPSSCGSGARETDLRRTHQGAACGCADRTMRIPHPRSCGIRTSGSTALLSTRVCRCRSVGMRIARSAQ